MFYITGSTRGLGKHLAEHFNCKQFNRPFDLNSDIDEICNSVSEGNAVILNAHASQLEYVKRLKDKCKMVIMGSIAAVNHDSKIPEYSKQKQQLEEFVQQLALYNNHPILYLQLTSSSYKDYATVVRSIEFWLENPSVTFIGYNINE